MAPGLICLFIYLSGYIVMLIAALIVKATVQKEIMLKDLFLALLLGFSSWPGILASMVYGIHAFVYKVLYSSYGRKVLWKYEERWDRT